MKKAFSWTLNAIAVMSAVVVIWQIAHANRERNPVGAGGPESGWRLQVSDLDLSAYHRTAILVLSTSCGYCRSSAGFYRSLLSAARHNGVRVIAILPEPKDVYEPALQQLGLERSDDVRQGNLTSLGVSATPTVLLVDDKSVVRQSWVGKLDSSQEREVYDALRLEVRAEPNKGASSPPIASTMLSPEELKKMMADPDFVLVDSRDRSDFAEAHIKGALNIPLDEFLARASHEVPADRAIAVVCPAISSCAAERRKEGVATMCDMAQTVVSDWAGFRMAKVIPGDLCALQAKGLPVEGNLKP